MKHFKICIKQNLKTFGLISVLFILLTGNALSSVSEKNLEIEITPEEVFQGGAVVVKITPESEIKSAVTQWKDNTIEFSLKSQQGTLFGVIGIDLDEKPGEKKLGVIMKDSSGQKIKEKIVFVVVEKDFPVQHLTLPESQVTPSSENLERIRKERQEVATVFQNSRVSDRFFDKPFIRPIKGDISTPFGVRRFMNNKPRNPHSGVDFRAQAGTPVHASNCGLVSFTGDHFFAGKSVYIDHGMGIITMYFHLSSIDVEQGQTVQVGDVIGRVGSTGRSTGPHLHWGARVTNQRIDALNLLELF